MQSIDNAVDAHITYIGSQYEKSKEVSKQIQKQKTEIQDKQKQITESCESAKDYYHRIFESLRQIIDEKEQKLIKEIDDKIGTVEQIPKKSDGTNNQKVKQTDSNQVMLNITEQEKYIEKLQEMMQIEILDNFEFLAGCKNRNEVIENAVRPISNVKYPAPVTKIRRDKIVDDIVKEMK